MRKVYFEKINNHKIFCAENIAKGSKKILIMCHGFRGESTGNSRAFVHLENKLNSNGISSLRFDQYGCGNSGGDFMEVEFEDWVNKISYFVEKYQKLEFEVSILGQSMGATAAGISASRIGNITNLFLLMPDPVTECDIDPEEIAEEKGQKYYGKFWVQAYTANLVETLNNYPNYVYVAYGDEDEVVAHEDRDKVIEAIAGSWNESNLLAGAKHGNWDYEEMEKILEKVVGKM